MLILSRDAIREREKEICSTSLSDLEEHRKKTPFVAESSSEEEKQRKKEAHREKMLNYFFGNAEEAIRKRESNLAIFREAHKRRREFYEAVHRKPEQQLLLEKMVWEREFYSFEEMKLKSLLGSKEYYWVTPLSKEEKEKEEEKREKELTANRQRGE
ncbi:uncharacterized protein [Nicotiana sylvestris]|uniref:uncharacterized protein n=1 Tax=Nicotiana sylvestris TaxID=4096 RepID=UPI00388C572D